ncbi:hypothetical protein ABKV19_003626 [Rosa sericea]
MDDELVELQKQFESAQQAKSSIRLSDRNVVELVQKLHELHIIDFDLLHTVSGKEYITPDQLRHEILVEVKRLGRISLIDLADAIGVDLYHVEKQAQHVVSDDPGLMLIQGEIISQSYWDSVAEEINERLQECSQVALAELAAQLHVSSEMVTSVLEPRLGTTQLLQEMEGASGVAVEGSFFQSLFNGLVKEGEILGSLRAGVHWTPNVFAIAQKESIDSFFSQNSFISYDVLQKLRIPQPDQFLQSRYPECIPLVTTFIHPSMIEMLDAAIEDALERGSWMDSLSILPMSFGSQDASKLLSLCPSIQQGLKSDKAIIFGESFVFSSAFIKDVYDRLEKEMETFIVSSTSGTMVSDDLQETKVGHETSRFTESNETVSDSSSNKQTMEKGSKKKKGRAAGNMGAGAAEGDPENQDSVPTKSKKNQRKGKNSSSAQVADSKASAKLVKSKEENLNIPSEDWMMNKIATLVPEFEEQGLDDPQTIIRPLANYVRPMLINSWKERRKALFTENAERMKHLLDNLQKKLDESFLNMQLYEKALDLFEDDPSTSVILHRHLLRTTATTIVDMLLLNLDMHNKLKNGVEVEDTQISESSSLNPGERTSIAKNFPGSLSKKALVVVEALEGKRVETFMTALRDIAEESGLLLKKLDKKLERTLLHSYQKDLASQVAAEMDPVSVLAKVVSLLYVQIHHKALQAPGRAIAVAVSRLKDKLDESAFKILTEYQTATVTLLALISAASGDEEDCTSDRILTKRELLENQMPALKGLVLRTGTSQS